MFAADNGENSPMLAIWGTGGQANSSEGAAEERPHLEGVPMRMASSARESGDEPGRRPGRPQGRGRAKYQALVSAARQLFLTDSYHRVTKRDLADRAGVDTALIRYYFGSKEGLYQAMLAETYNGVIRDLRQLARGPFPGSVAELFEMAYGLYGQQPELALLVFKTLVLKEGPSREFLLQDIVLHLRSYVIRVFDSLIAQGVIDPSLDTDLLEEAFASLCFRPFQMRGMWSERYGAPAADRYIRRLFEQNSRLFERAIRCPGAGYGRD